VVVGQHLEGAWVRPARVVDEEVDSAERLRRAGDEVAHLLRVGDVRGECVRGADLLGGRQHLRFVARADRDAGSLADQFPRDRLAEPLRPAGDEPAAAFEAELHFERR
jgi:hypothetical protein